VGVIIYCCLAWLLEALLQNNKKDRELEILRAEFNGYLSSNQTPTDAVDGPDKGLNGFCKFRELLTYLNSFRASRRSKVKNGRLAQR
jgi:hypothetical protein